MSDSRIGIVKWFDKDKGYGFIVSPTGEDVFVHYRSIMAEGYRQLNEGQKVKYEQMKGEKGWQASNVVAIEETSDELAIPISDHH